MDDAFNDAKEADTIVGKSGGNNEDFDQGDQ